MLLKAIARHNKPMQVLDVVPTIRATHYKNGDNQPLIKQLNNPTHSNDRVYASDGISPTLNTMQGGNRQPFIALDQDNDMGYNGSQDANATQTRPNKALSALQEADSQTTLQQRGADVTTTLQEDEVLQSGVYEKSVRGELQNGQSELDDFPLQGKADIQATPSKHLRNMQKADTHRDTPQERGLAGQNAEMIENAIPVFP